jgi:hypothetical protein
MRNRIYLLGIIFTLLAAPGWISGCKKAEEPGDWTRMTFIFEGKRTSWAGYDVSVQFQAGRMVLTAKADDGSSVQLATDQAVVGNYRVEGDSALTVVNLSSGSDPLKIFVADTGVVSITSADLEKQLIQGVFDVQVVNLATDKRGRALGSFRTFFAL